ncbi:MAG: hypothetical protein E7315_00120 [Clostridiales bacterium]|nr:hypothetical protein [Clostridiales bacterium]
MAKIKKILAMLFIGVCFISVCACTEVTPAVPQGTPQVIVPPSPVVSGKILDVRWARVATSTLGSKALEFLLENFSIRVKEMPLYYVQDDSAIFSLFSSGYEVDIATGISTEAAKSLASDGKLLNLSSYWGKLLSYQKMWSAGRTSWDTVQNMLTHEDGNVYMLLPMSQQTPQGYIYKKSFFDERSLVFPTTLQELYDILSAYKTEFPSSIPWMNRHEPQQFNAILNAHGLSSDTWQQSSSGNLFYLYSDSRYLSALDWLMKFEKEGLVPTDAEGRLTQVGTGDADYLSATKNSLQVIEYTDLYRYISVQELQKDTDIFSVWAQSDTLISSGGYAPVIELDSPFVNEAVVIAATDNEELAKRLVAFVDWLCTDEGAMWCAFGEYGEGYVFIDGQWVFLRYFNEDYTPYLDPKTAGSITPDIAPGRILAAVPYSKIISPVENKFAFGEKLVASNKYKAVLPISFASQFTGLGSLSELSRYYEIEEAITKITNDFIEGYRKGEYTSDSWPEYVVKLNEAGINEYTQYMSVRAGIN